MQSFTRHPWNGTHALIFAPAAAALMSARSPVSNLETAPIQPHIERENHTRTVPRKGRSNASRETHQRPRMITTRGKCQRGFATRKRPWDSLPGNACGGWLGRC